MNQPAAEAPDDVVRLLEAVNAVAREYGLSTAQLKTCIAQLLDGNLGGAERHEAAYLIAIEFREHGESAVKKLLQRWAPKVECPATKIRAAIRGAFQRLPDGSWKYYAPGLQRKGTIGDRVLRPTCEAVGCPANCPRYAGRHSGPQGETFKRFEQLGWPLVLKRARQSAVIDHYSALCELERERGFAPGALLLITWRQLGERAGRDFSKVGRNLVAMVTLGLVADYVPGSGSGPNARDRRASRLRRVVPIPKPPQPAAADPTPTGAINTGGQRPPQIGGQRPSKEIGGQRPANIGGLPKPRKKRRR